MMGCIATVAVRAKTVILCRVMNIMATARLDISSHVLDLKNVVLTVIVSGI